jgi:ribosomal protein S18 acetylase RimI-like enzyme
MDSCSQYWFSHFREEYEQVWHELFVDAIFNSQYRTYLALLDGKPVGTSQLFLSEGVAGIYNVTVLPEARHQGIGQLSH